MKPQQTLGFICPLFLCYCLLSACSSSPTFEQKALPELTGHEPVTIEKADLLAISEPMKRFLDDHVRHHRNPLNRLKALNRAVYHPDLLAFNYELAHTLTAQRAFDQRAGNCVAFANMVIAMARDLGLKAHYQEVLVPSTWTEQSDVFRVDKHVNVQISIRDKEYVLDTSGGKITDRGDTEVRSDATGEAYYYNNLAIDALLNSDLPKAYALLNTALERDDSLSFVWSNLGVLYKRANQLPDAQWAYQEALARNPGNHSALTNLSNIYLSQGSKEQAQLLQVKAEAHRLNNPYYLMLSSREAADKADYDNAIELLRKAIRKKNNEYRFHYELAKLYYLDNQFKRAETSYRRAQRLAPANVRNNELSAPLRAIVADHRNAASP